MKEGVQKRILFDRVDRGRLLNFYFDESLLNFDDSPDWDLCRQVLKQAENHQIKQFVHGQSFALVVKLAAMVIQVRGRKDIEDFFVFP